jgi:hypothetical protein
MPIFLAGFTKLNSMTENNMTGLLLQLADRGVTGIKVTYEGSGDSGAIENVIYTSEKLSEDEEDAFSDINDIYVWGQDVMPLSKLDSGLESDIANFVEEQLLNDIEDWWNNEGGSGSVCILVPSGKYKIINDIRIVEIETYLHEGSLIQKTL